PSKLSTSSNSTEITSSSSDNFSAEISSNKHVITLLIYSYSVTSLALNFDRISLLYSFLSVIKYLFTRPPQIILRHVLVLFLILLRFSYELVLLGCQNDYQKYLSNLAFD